ncbi:hypothetical protein B7Z17_03135 [Candidatus Saccharibacteria bacterium 32-49-10]|nr:MAG: hypothetical protein B7Z17_03135 [Candidatus Saccharibacteria bacterium 32-49-10]
MTTTKDDKAKFSIPQRHTLASSDESDSSIAPLHSQPIQPASRPVSSTVSGREKAAELLKAQIDQLYAAEEKNSVTQSTTTELPDVSEVSLESITNNPTLQIIEVADTADPTAKPARPLKPVGHSTEHAHHHKAQEHEQQQASQVDVTGSYARSHDEATDHTAATNNTAMSADWQKYHTEWQKYYQQYYERYYISQLINKQ